MFKWEDEKNEWLKENRNVSFEDVLQSIQDEENILDDLEHHNPQKHPGQRILVVRIVGKVYFVPYVPENGKGEIWLRTIYRCERKAKKYGG